MVRPILHLVLHAVVPAAVARLVWPTRLWRAWALMTATLVIDLDHLLADPIYDPSRCSIGTHPLHGAWAAALYAALLLPRPTRLVGAGLVIHLILDGLDCLMM